MVICGRMVCSVYGSSQLKALGDGSAVRCLRMLSWVSIIIMFCPYVVFIILMYLGWFVCGAAV